MTKEINSGYFDQPKNKSFLWKIMWAACIISLGLEFFVKRKSHFGVNGIDGYFGFYAGLGFFACFIFVIIAKGLGYILKVKEDYYND